MIFNILGWIGMVLILLVYALLSLKKIDNSFIYQFMNLVASVLMAIGLYPTKAWFSFLLQVIWALVALYALFLLNKKKTAKKSK